jgi:hypothetical protein
VVTAKTVELATPGAVRTLARANFDRALLDATT